MRPTAASMKPPYCAPGRCFERYKRLNWSETCSHKRISSLTKKPACFHLCSIHCNVPGASVLVPQVIYERHLSSHNSERPACFRFKLLGFLDFVGPIFHGFNIPASLANSLGHHSLILRSELHGIASSGKPSLCLIGLTRAHSAEGRQHAWNAWLARDFRIQESCDFLLSHFSA